MYSISAVIVRIMDYVKITIALLCKVQKYENNIDIWYCTPLIVVLLCSVYNCQKLLAQKQ